MAERDSFGLKIVPGGGWDGSNFLLVLLRPRTPLQIRRLYGGDKSILIGSFETEAEAESYKQKMLEDLGVADITHELLGDLATGKRQMDPEELAEVLETNG